jgi:hypothetical protein
MGWNAHEGFLHYGRTYLLSIWLSTMLEGEMSLPTPKRRKTHNRTYCFMETLEHTLRSQLE